MSSSPPGPSPNVSAKGVLAALTPSHPGRADAGSTSTLQRPKPHSLLWHSSPSAPVNTVAATTAPDTAAPPPTVGGPYGPLLSQSLSNNVTPPDTQMAAGAGYLLEVVNTEGGVYKTDGTPVVVNFSLLDLFPLESGFHFSDPRVAYDPSAGRWLVTILEFQATAGPPAHVASRVYIATSANVNPDPTTAGSWAWTKVYPVTAADQTIADQELCDQPQLGWSNDKIAVSCNNFNASNMFVNATTRIIDKADLYAGMPIVYQDFTGSLADGAHASLSPAYSYGSTAVQYLIFNRESTPQNYAGVIAVTGRPDSVAGITAVETDLPIKPSNQPPGADQPGTSAKLDTGDNRFMGATWRDGKLWTAGDDGCQPSGDTVVRACARFVQVNTGGSLTINQDFDLGASGLHYIYPAVTMDSSDDMVAVFTVSGSSTFPSIAYVSQLAADAPGTTDGVNTLIAGQRFYSDPFGDRWGDYSGATPDPQQPGAVWIAGEYMPSAASSFWGTGAAQITLHRAPGCGYASVTANKPSPQPLNTAVTFTATGGGCVGTPLYEFWVLTQGIWKEVQAYSTSNSWNLDYTKLLAYGTSTIDVWVLDPGSTNQYDAFALMAWVIGGCNYATTTNTSGTTYTTTAGGVACTNPEYKVWMVGKGLLWTMERDWSTNPSFDVGTVSGLAAGTYSVDVWVREQGVSNDPSYLETWGLATYVKGTTACSTAMPTMTATPPSPSTWGMVTLNATGCGSGAQYKFWIYPGSGGGYQVIRDWGSASATWNAAAAAAGNYSLIAWARQQGSTTVDYDSYALYSFAVGGAVTATIATSKTNPQPQATVGMLTLTASSAGAPAPEYSFWILPPGNAQWQNIQPYSSTPTASWTPPAPGTYAVVVWARQHGGPTPANAYETYALMSFTTTQ